MLKMEYFKFRLLLGVLRSKQVSGKWWHHSVYSVNVRGSFKLSTCQGTVLPPGAVMPQVTLVVVAVMSRWDHTVVRGERYRKRER